MLPTVRSNTGYVRISPVLRTGQGVYVADDKKSIFSVRECNVDSIALRRETKGVCGDKIDDCV